MHIVKPIAGEKPSSTFLSGLSGILATLIADEEGRVVEASAQVTEPETVAAVIATAARELGRLGAALGLGAAELLSIKADTSSGLIGMQRGAIAFVEIDAKRATGDLEDLLRRARWAPENVRPQGVVLATAPATGSGATPSPVFAGDLQSFSVPDVLEFLRNGQRTGTLTFTSDAGTGTVYLRRGKLTGATSPSAIGVADYLVAFGLVSHDQLAALGHLPEPLVGQKLLERGQVKAEDLRRALLARTQGAIRELVTWEDGRFGFDASQVAAPIPGVDMEVDVQSLLLNIFKELDESARR